MEINEMEEAPTPKRRTAISIQELLIPSSPQKKRRFEEPEKPKPIPHKHTEDVSLEKESVEALSALSNLRENTPRNQPEKMRTRKAPKSLPQFQPEDEFYSEEEDITTDNFEDDDDDDLVVRPTSRWDQHFEELKQYRERLGNCNVPSIAGPLGYWVRRMRDLKKSGRLEKTWSIKLDSLGFEWKPSNRTSSKPKLTWEQMYEELRRFKDKNGHCKPPSASRLGLWVYSMRSNGKKGLLPKHKMELLNDIGFVWNTSNDTPLASPNSLLTSPKSPPKDEEDYYDEDDDDVDDDDDDEFVIEEFESKENRSQVFLVTIEPESKIHSPPSPPEKKSNHTSKLRFSQYSELISESLVSLGGKGTLPEIMALLEPKYGKLLSERTETWRNSVAGTLSRAFVRGSKDDMGRIVWMLPGTKIEEKTETKSDTVSPTHKKVQQYSGDDISYQEMIKDALKALGGKAVVHDIVSYIAEKYADRIVKRTKTWRNSISGCLSTHFTPAGRDDDGRTIWSSSKVDGWKEMYEKLKKFKEKHQNCNIPQSEADLFIWLNSMRHRKKNGRMSWQKIEMLDNLGVNWELPKESAEEKSSNNT